MVLTDPSPTFLDITRHKLQQINIYNDAVQLAVLMAEEIDRLPPNTFALIVLRSTLHHVMDVSQFIHNTARALRPGGILTFEEPCMEGYVLMGAMAQFIPLIIKQAGAKLGNHHSQQIQLFVDTMRFYARRDIDKSKAEDKHLFRVDEIMKTGDDAGLSVEFLPNTTYDNYVSPVKTKAATTSFYLFFRNYLRYCMNFDETLVELLDQHFRSYCQFIEDISKDGNGPYMHGVFVCQKR
ncbi:MAG: class I SAM-dependent methyltransferase [Anaerolineales bacterium]|nr:class I SAM-dependent methyltransferase [Anaerolineales bacterium]